MSKGRTVPDSPIDHAAALRDRLGKAAHDAGAGGPSDEWESLTDSGRAYWRNIGRAVMDVIVTKGDRRGDFSVSSIYGYASQKPYVNVEVSMSPMQCSPAKAREMALMLLECADAAESDSVLIRFGMDVLDMNQSQAAQLLNQFRIFREKQRGTPTNVA